MMNKFGVCNYNIDSYISKVENLECFDTYEDAFEYYIKQLMKYHNYPYTYDDTLWIVWIEDDTIVQFQQLADKTKVKLVKINGDEV